MRSHFRQNPALQIFPNSFSETNKGQQVRRYASDAPNSGGNNGILYTGIGAAGLAGAYLYMRGGDAPSGQQGNAPPSEEAKKIPGSTDGSVKKAFTGGDQGFLSLMLEKSEIVNHNTKKLRFKLPEEDMESGLPVACMLTNGKCLS
jgi:cytochrome-b5 reductase